jgi:hypothetical protein
LKCFWTEMNNKLSVRVNDVLRLNQPLKDCTIPLNWHNL